MINFLIVDDETASHDVIKDYADNLSFLKYQKSCYNAFEAMEYLSSNSVDLVFLDINMPKLSGLDFLRSLSSPPNIIITTAYKEFAIEGYELSIVDYLLKPYDFNRFLKAVNKVHPLLKPQAKSTNSSEDKEEGQIFIKEDKKYYQIKLKDILFIEAYGNYVKVHLKEKTILSHQSLISFMQSLPEDKFIRVHKSFIVAIDKIELIEGNRIEIDDEKIPIGKMYKLNVNRLLE